MPAALQHLGEEPLTLRAATVAARHIGLGPGLIDEDENQARWIDPVLILLPARPPTGHVRTILLAGVQGFI